MISPKMFNAYLIGKAIGERHNAFNISNGRRKHKFKFDDAIECFITNNNDRKKNVYFIV